MSLTCHRSLLLAVIGLATFLLDHANAQSAAPGLIFPFYSGTFFTINCTSHQTSSVIGIPNATNPYYIAANHELENATSTLGSMLIVGNGIGSSADTSFTNANVTATGAVLNVNGSAADSISFTFSAQGIKLLAWPFVGQITNGTGKYANALGVIFGQSVLIPQSVTDPTNIVFSGPTTISGYVAVPTNATNLAAVLGGTSSSASASTAAPAATI